MSNLVEKLEAANQGLIGSKEHHAAIKEAIEFLKKHEDTLRLADQIFQSARPVILNMMNFEQAVKDFK